MKNNIELKKELFKKLYGSLIDVRFAELSEKEVLEISQATSKQFAEGYNLS